MDNTPPNSYKEGQFPCMKKSLFLALIALVCIQITVETLSASTLGALAADTQIPLEIEGRLVGSMTLKAGTQVNIIKVLPDGVMISKGESTPVKVAVESITASSLAVVTATPVPTPTPVPTATPIAIQSPVLTPAQTPSPTPSTQAVISEGYKSIKNTPIDLTTDIRKIQNMEGLGNLSAVVIKDSKIYGVGAAGPGTWKQKPQLSTNDSFVIASCSKTFTATLAGICVDKGLLRWDSTLGEVFPELKTTMNPEYASVTLEQLLSHTGRAPERDAFWRSTTLQTSIAHPGTSRDQRYYMLKEITRSAPAIPPGRYVYSNAGFYMVAAMLEKVTNESWENLMKTKIFDKYNLSSASAVSTVDPLVTMSAGGISCSLTDLANLCILHMKKPSENTLVSPENFSKLHQPPVGTEGYAMGVLVTRRDWAHGPAFTHMGMDREFVTVYWVSPTTGFGVVAATKNSGPGIDAKLDKAVGELIQTFNK